MFLFLNAQLHHVYDICETAFPIIVPGYLLYCLFFIQIQFNLAVIPGQTFALYLTLYLATDVPESLIKCVGISVT